jgi:hypothetical protein
MYVHNHANLANFLYLRLPLRWLQLWVVRSNRARFKKCKFSYKLKFSKPYILAGFEQMIFWSWSGGDSTEPRIQSHAVKYYYNRRNYWLRLLQGLFSEQNRDLGQTLEGLAMVDVGIFYRHLVYFTGIWYRYLWSFGLFCWNFVYFPRFGTLHQEKSGNPGLQSVAETKYEKLKCFDHEKS